MAAGAQRPDDGLGRRPRTRGPASTRCAGAACCTAAAGLFPHLDVTAAYLLLFGVYSGIVPDGIDDLTTGDIDWAGDASVLLSYVKRRTAAESADPAQAGGPAPGAVAGSLPAAAALVPAAGPVTSSGWGSAARSCGGGRGAGPPQRDPAVARPPPAYVMSTAGR